MKCSAAADMISLKENLFVHMVVIHKVILVISKLMSFQIQTD